MRKKSYIQKITVLIALCMLAISACERKPDRLQYALEFAGKNRIELEKVLEHYKSDSLKYRAACFLIKNMPRWYAYDGWQLDTLHTLMSKQLKGTLTEDEKKRWQGFDYRTLKKVYDAHIITSDYLIENIDMAFKEWRERPWNRTLPFKDFCELILPYRVGNERLSEWRKLYRSYYGHLLDSLYQGSDVLEACKVVNDELNRQDCSYCIDWNVPHHDADKLFYARIGYCRENSDLIQYAMRSCGIPVAADFMPYSPDYRYSHEWNVVRDTTSKYIQFGYDAIDPVRKNSQSDGRKKGKIYRYCYALQEERESIYKQAGWNMGGTEGKYWKDVTSEYFGSNEALVNLIDYDKSPIGLSVFSVNGWQVIGEGVRKNRTMAHFNNIEPAIIYMAVKLGSEIQPAGYPFMLTKNGQVEEFVPDTANCEEVVLSRKMALIPRVAAWGYSQIGARIEGDNDIKFSNPRLMAEIKDTIDYTFQVWESNYTNPIRYIRYVPPTGILQVAEIKLYEDTSLEKEIRMKPVTLLPYIEHVTDGDILSFLYLTSEGIIEPLVFALERPQSIRSIYYVTRTDDNYVWEGDVYELLYQDGPDGWKSLGTKTATSKHITFNAPKNALLWLRDKTKGREEQVFIYKHNRQWFNSDFK